MPLPSLKELEKKAVKKPAHYEPIPKPTKPGRTPQRRYQKTIEQEAAEENQSNNKEPKNEEVQDDLDDKTWSELVDIIIREDDDEGTMIKDLLKLTTINDNEKMTNKKGGSKTGNVSSGLEKIKKTYEDVIAVTELRKFIRDNIGKKTDNNPPPQQQQANNDMSSIIPLLTNINDGEIDIQQLLPLLQLTGNNNNSNLIQPLINSLIMKVMLKAKSTNKEDNGDYAKIISEVSNQIASVLQQQNQKPAIDTNALLLNKILNINNRSQDSNQSNQLLSLMIDKFGSMMDDNRNKQLEYIINNQNNFFQKIAESLAGALHSPMGQFKEHFNFFKDIQGEAYKKTKDDFDHDIKLRELDLEEKRRDRALEIEAHRENIEAAKSNRVFDMAEKFAMPLISGGLGQVIRDIKSASGSSTPTIVKKGLNDSRKMSLEDLNYIED